RLFPRPPASVRRAVACGVRRELPLAQDGSARLMILFVASVVVGRRARDLWEPRLREQARLSCQEDRSLSDRGQSATRQLQRECHARRPRQLGRAEEIPSVEALLVVLRVFRVGGRPPRRQVPSGGLSILLASWHRHPERNPATAPPLP